MAWNDGAGQYLGPETGGYYNPADETSVPLFGSADYNKGGSGGLLLPGQSVGYTNAMDSMGLVPNYTDANSTAASYQNGGINAAGELGNGLAAAGGGGMSGAGMAGSAIGTIANAYNGASTDTTGSVMSGVAQGAATGAMIGSVVPVVGTVIGAVVGGIIGGIAGFFGSKSKKAAAKKAFQEQETIAVLPDQQRQANWLQQQGLEQKAIGNYASGYTPGGYNYTNALTGKKGAGFATPGPAGANLPNFNVAPPNVVSGNGDASLGIPAHSNPSSGINPTAYSAPGAGYGPIGLSAPTSGFAPPPNATAPTAPTYSTNKATNQQNLNTYQQQYMAYINAQRQQIAGADMSPYAAFNG